jgi:hypothetical protein
LAMLVLELDDMVILVCRSSPSASKAIVGQSVGILVDVRCRDRKSL